MFLACVFFFALWDIWCSHIVKTTDAHPRKRPSFHGKKPTQPMMLAFTHLIVQCRINYMWSLLKRMHPRRDGFREDTHGYEFGCHYLPHFISNSDTSTNIIEYEYQTDISNSEHSNTYSIYSIES
jgi:hypothetical protein